MLARRGARSRRFLGKRGTIGGEPTSPAALASVLSFFRADVGLTVSGSNVTQINDQVGSGLVGNMTPTAGATITKTTQANGKPDITFAGGALKGSTALPSSAGAVLFGTLVCASSVAEQRVWGKNYNNYVEMAFIDATGHIGFRAPAPTDAASVSVIDGAAHFFIMQWAPNVASGLMILRLDGADKGLVATTTTAFGASSDVWSVGSGSDGTNTFDDFHGRMGAWGIAKHDSGTPISAGDISTIETWLAWYLT